jgi:hypothetical protein
MDHAFEKFDFSSISAIRFAQDSAALFGF